MRKWRIGVLFTESVARLRKFLKRKKKNRLRALPKDRWEVASWSQCTVRRDWRIMFDSSYYSVPYELIGQLVEVCATRSLVRIFYRHKEVAYHERSKIKWDYKRKAEYAPPFHEAVLQCNREGLLSTAEIDRVLIPIKWHKQSSRIP